MKKALFAAGIFLFIVQGCAPAAQTAAATPTPAPSETPMMIPTSSATAPPSPTAAPPLPPSTPTPDTRLAPKYWHQWEILPPLSPAALEILKRGVQNGNDVHFFTRIGDCQSEPGTFLGIYATDDWILPEAYQSAAPAIDFFAESFAEENVTAKRGFGISSALNPLFADPARCQPSETPLECELRLHHPIVAFIAMGTNWIPNASASFEKYLRQVVAVLIENGTLPVIVTKPDNIEGDGSLNLAMAKVAYDEDIPLLNIWRALDSLPAHGLEEDGVYMTPDAWRVRDWYALLLLEEVRQAILTINP